MERIFDIQGFSGGESDDLTRGPKDSFYQAENVEVRKDLSGASLSCKLTDTGWSISGDIIFMCNLRSFGIGSSDGIVVATDTGNVYLNGTLKQTISTGENAWNRIIGAGVMRYTGTDYIYFITQTTLGDGKIHRTTTNLATWNISYKSFDTGNGQSSEIAIFQYGAGGELLFAINNSVIGIAPNELVTTRLVLSEKESISGFTQFQNNYKIYSNVGSTGVQYYWDGIIEEPLYRQEWEGLNVVCVTNNGAYDYAIMGDSSSESYNDLYVISGTQKQELRVNLEANTNSRVFNKNISIREDIIYISGGKTGESDNYGIYTYGNYYPGTPKSLVQSYSGATNKFIFHAHGIASSYFACNDDKVYQIEHNNPPSNLKYSSTGYLVSNLYEGNIWEEIKISRGYVGFNLQPGTSIKIYGRTEIGFQWKLMKTFDYDTYGNKKGGKIYSKELLSLGFGNIYSFQMKLELLSDNSRVYTPTIKRATMFFDVVNNT